MSNYDDDLEKKEVKASLPKDTDSPCQHRRRLLAVLGIGVAAAYIAPTLFSVGQAEARHRQDQRGSYSRDGYSGSSYSRPSGYDYRRRERNRLREYAEDPVLILEDVILGPPRR